MPIRRPLPYPVLARALVPAVLLVLAFGLSACASSRHADAVESIAFGDLNVESSAFVYIAQEQHLFAQNGLDVAIKTFDTGPAAIDAMMNNQVDLVTSGEFPFLVRVLAKDNLTAIGTMDKFQAFYLIGRKDRGIANITDLKGKTVGLVRQTLAEFYLGRLLDLNGMNIRSVNVVDVRPAQWVDAIANGTVDAIIVSQGYLSQIRDRLQQAMVTWPAQSNQDAFGLVYGRKDWVTGHPELVRRFLTSLAQAQDFTSHNLARAQAIVRQRLNLDESYLAAAWPQHQFALSLDQSLVLAMEDETRWMIANNLTTEKQVPNFMGYIYEDALKMVKREAVNIIR